MAPSVANGAERTVERTIPENESGKSLLADHGVFERFDRVEYGLHLGWWRRIKVVFLRLQGDAATRIRPTGKALRYKFFDSRAHLRPMQDCACPRYGAD